MWEWSSSTSTPHISHFSPGRGRAGGFISRSSTPKAADFSSIFTSGSSDASDFSVPSAGASGVGDSRNCLVRAVRKSGFWLLTATRSPV